MRKQSKLGLTTFVVSMMCVVPCVLVNCFPIGVFFMVLALVGWIVAMNDVTFGGG